jgi:signal transduction histidine kinase
VHSFLPRLRWPLVVLLASIGLTAVAAIEAQRAVRSQQGVAERALREYASFAAWAYAQRVTDTLGMVQREALGAVNHGENLHTGQNVPHARDLAHYLPWSDACMCHRTRVGPSPEAFFAIKVGEKTLDAGLNTHADPMEGWEVDRPMPAVMPVPAALKYSTAERAWLLDSLTRRVRGLGDLERGFTFVVGHVDDAPRIVAYTVMPTSWGDTMVYGARYSRESFVRVLEGVLDGTGLLPATFTEGRRNRDILAVRVRDRLGNTLFESAPGFDVPRGAHVDLPARAGFLSVDAAIRPELAGSLIIGGLPASRLPFLLGLLGLAAALSIVAVTQLKREGELAQLRSGFVSSVSHQLRTPVAQIRLYLDTLRLGRAEGAEQRDWSLGHIERETTRLSHLVENVLRFSTIGGDDPTHRDLTNVGVEVGRIVDEFRPLAASKKASIELSATETPMVPLKPDTLRHVLLNLLDNAVKYGPLGQTVRVGVATLASGVEISVEDDGPGVSEAERERIWRPFTRGERGTETGGSGIGLSVVHDVVAAHNGSARVESAPSGGARFVVLLPTASVGSTT